MVKRLEDSFMFDSKKPKTLNKSFITTLLTLSLLTSGCIASSKAVNANENKDNTEKVTSVSTNLPVVKCKNLPSGRGSVVYINNKQAVWFLKGSGNYTAEQRAQLFANNLNNLLKNGINPRDIRPYKSGPNTIIKAGNVYLLTADDQNAKAFGVSTHELAFKWANDTRAALGAPKLVRYYSLVVSRGGYSIDFQREHLGKTFSGMASWYGGQFHGRTSSDGSRFNMHEFTAAHRTLPFGTLVKVTNTKNNKSCVVKITDRGPFVHGRVLDLSKAAAAQLGMVSSGVARIEAEVIGKY